MNAIVSLAALVIGLWKAYEAGISNPIACALWAIAAYAVATMGMATEAYEREERQ